MSAKKLPIDMVQNRLENWIGYGNLDADFWIIGMEEGGETTYAEQLVRMSLPPVSDNKEFHDLLNKKSEIKTYWYADEPKAQSTYLGIAKILVCAESYCGKKTANDSHPNLKQQSLIFQRDRLGRTGQNNLLAELMPLSKPSLDSWPYEALTDHPDLQDRDDYYDKWKPRRVEVYKKLISEHNPKVVIAYGKGKNQEFWKIYTSIFGKGGEEIICRRANRIMAKAVGNLILVEHPVSGLSDIEVITIGHWIRKNRL